MSKIILGKSMNEATTVVARVVGYRLTTIANNNVVGETEVMTSVQLNFCFCQKPFMIAVMG